MFAACESPDFWCVDWCITASQVCDGARECEQGNLNEEANCQRKNLLFLFMGSGVSSGYKLKQ